MIVSVKERFNETQAAVTRFRGRFPFNRLMGGIETVIGVADGGGISGASRDMVGARLIFPQVDRVS